MIASPTIVDLDPSTLSPSPFAPRTSEPQDSATFQQLFDSIRLSGQQVPILVARDGDGLVCVYGHRRLRVAELLGRNVTAIVGDLGPLDALMAQGLENSSRLDLTFIEKARFAARLHKEGVDPDLIARTMAVDATTVSRFLKVARAIDPLVLDRIGRAPNIGRPRWISLAKAYEKRSQNIVVRRAAYRTLEEEGFDKLTSDRRFEKVRSAIFGKTKQTTTTLVVQSSDDRVIARVNVLGDGSQLIRIDGERVKFADALVEALPGLFRSYEAGVSLQGAQMPASGSTIQGSRRRRGSGGARRGPPRGGGGGPPPPPPPPLDARSAPTGVEPAEASTTGRR